jgi:hypothetical protein
LGGWQLSGILSAATNNALLITSRKVDNTSCPDYIGGHSVSGFSLDATSSIFGQFTKAGGARVAQLKECLSF